MTKTKSLRAGLMATAAGASLIALAGSAAALEYNVGSVKITFDTTITLGGSMRLADRDNRFLPEANGGNFDRRSGAGGVVLSNPAAAGFGLQGATTLAGVPIATMATLTNNNNNFDGSINGDDGRLNFDNGDWIGATAKASHDLSIAYENFTIFSRFYYFYDNIMAGGVGRSGLSDDALNQVGSSVELLDLYISGDFTLGDLPLNLRAGKQVVSWGEGTFQLNGINVINPIDVSAFRRPGAEIKEGLLPVPLAYMSLGLPANLSLEAFYQFKFEPYQVDSTGTPFSGADVITDFNTNGLGNLGGRSYTSGGIFGGTRRNCLGDSDGAGGTFSNGSGDTASLGGISGGVAAGLLAAPTCVAGSAQDFMTPNTIGLAERDRNLRGDQDIVTRGTDINPSNDGQFGVALRWYAEELGATEFSLYYVNYASRLPFVQLTAGAPILNIGTTGSNANITPQQLAQGAAGVSGALAGRFAPAIGCINPAFGAAAAPGVFLDPRFAALAAQTIADPSNLINATSMTVANAFLGDSDPITAGIQPYFSAAQIATPATAKTFRSAMGINCALALAQSKLVDLDGSGTLGTAGDLPLLINGSETLNVQSETQLDIIYPEDIQLFGFSFNTTIGGWGVQGEISYRPDAPFQTDTDAQTIEAAASACAFPVAVGDLGFVAFEGQNVNGIANCNPGATNHLDGVGRYRTTAIIENDMWSFSLGTTATFTNSDEVIGFLGADLGILVTEIGGFYVPDVEQTYLLNDNLTPTAIARNTLQYQGIGCQGSDLPLGGLLALDTKASSECRPTDFSFGYVLLARLDYNNAFGSGWVVSPQLAFSHDVLGATPAPYSNYLEDRMSINFSVSATLDNAWRLGASYTNFFGGGIKNKATDQDFGSLTFSYSF